MNERTTTSVNGLDDMIGGGFPEGRGETAVFKLVSHKRLGDARAYVVVVKYYGIESMTLEEIQSMIEKRMSPLRQGEEIAAS